MRLPLGVTLHDDEPMSSLLQRTAKELRCRACDILSALDISAHGDHSLAGVLNLKLSTRTLRRLSEGLGRHRDRLQRTLLATYAPIAFDLQAAAARTRSDRDLPQYLARHEWLYVIDTHACPACLAERDGATRLRWKLPWSIACVHHQRPLLDRCPTCTRRFGLTRAGNPPAWLSAKPHATPLGAACANRRGSGRGPCAGPLYGAATIPTGVLAAQRAIDRVLDGHAAIGTDRVISPPEFIRELRALTVLILAEGDPDIQITEIPEHHHRLTRHYAQRDTARSEAVGRHTVLSPCPRDVTLLTAVIPCAVDALLGGRLALQIVLEPIAKRTATQRPRLGANHVPGRFGFTAALNDAWNDLLAPRWQRIRRLGIANEQPATALQYSARCIPQLLWEPVYEFLFADMLADWEDQDLARRYCSLALARFGPCRSWRDAAHALDLQHSADGKGTGANHLKRIDQGPGEAFTANLRTLATAIAGQDQWVDYAQRRRQLADGLIVPPSRWPAIQEICDVDLDHPSNRQILELWLWQHATSGYWRAAPERLVTGIRRGAWRRFNDVIAPSTPALTGYLEQHVLGQPVCPDTAHPSPSTLLAAAAQQETGPQQPSTARHRANARRRSPATDILTLLPPAIELDVQRWSETLTEPRTRSEYERRVRRYLRLSTDRGLDTGACADEILKARIQAFTDGCTDSSAKLYQSALRSFWKHQASHPHPARDGPHRPLPTAETLRREWRQSPVLTADEAREVLVAATHTEPQTLVGICLLLLYGMQVSGISALTADDFTEVSPNELLVAGRYPLAKRFHLPVVEPARSAIRAILQTNPPGEPLLGTKRTTPNSLRRLSQTPGWTPSPLTHPLRPRLLKHTFRSLALDAGADPIILAILTTKRPTDATDDTKRQITRLPDLVLARLGEP